MTESVPPIRIFVSCPGDVAPEKVALAGVVRDANATWAPLLGTSLTLLDWEHDTFSRLGTRPQQEVTRQIGPYDIYLGVMHARFGTPTGVARSGTEEELNEALELHRRTNGMRPSISFFFKNTPIQGSTEDLRQALVVAEFRASMNSRGLSQAFSTTHEFSYLVNRTLFHAVRDLLARRASFAPRPVFLHFLDHHYLDMIGQGDRLTKDARREAILASRLAYLYAGAVTSSAAAYVESPICREVFDSLALATSADAVAATLVGGATHFHEYTDSATGQYGSSRQRKYKGAALPEGLAFRARSKSATVELGERWSKEYAAGRLDSAIGSLRVGQASAFRKRFEQLPTLLGKRAFIAEHAARVLYGRKGTLAQRGTLHLLINKYYFESILDEFHFGVLADLTLLGAQMHLVGSESCSYALLLEAAKKARLLKILETVSGDRLPAIRASSDWRAAVASIGGAVVKQ